MTTFHLLFRSHVGSRVCHAPSPANSSAHHRKCGVKPAALRSSLPAGEGSIPSRQ